VAQHYSVGTKCSQCLRQQWQELLALIAGTIWFLNISSYISTFKFPSIKNRSIKILFKISAQTFISPDIEYEILISNENLYPTNLYPNI